MNKLFAVVALSLMVVAVNAQYCLDGVDNSRSITGTNPNTNKEETRKCDDAEVAAGMVGMDNSIKAAGGVDAYCKSYEALDKETKELIATTAQCCKDGKAICGISSANNMKMAFGAALVVALSFFSNLM